MTELTENESIVLAEIRNIKYGTVTVTVRNGKITLITPAKTIKLD